jgi:hypothetical protein
MTKQKNSGWPPLRQPPLSNANCFFKASSTRAAANAEWRGENRILLIAEPATIRVNTPAELIDARGMWKGTPDTPLLHI